MCPHSSCHSYCKRITTNEALDLATAQRLSSKGKRPALSPSQQGATTTAEAMRFRPPHNSARKPAPLFFASCEQLRKSPVDSVALQVASLTCCRILSRRTCSQMAQMKRRSTRFRTSTIRTEISWSAIFRQNSKSIKRQLLTQFPPQAQMPRDDPLNRTNGLWLPTVRNTWNAK